MGGQALRRESFKPLGNPAQGLGEDDGVLVAFGDHAGELQAGERGLGARSLLGELVEDSLELRDGLVELEKPPCRPRPNPPDPYPVEWIGKAWRELVEHRQRTVQLVVIPDLGIGQGERVES